MELSVQNNLMRYADDRVTIIAYDRDPADKYAKYAFKQSVKRHLANSSLNNEMAAFTV